MTPSWTPPGRVRRPRCTRRIRAPIHTYAHVCTYIHARTHRDAHLPLKLAFPLLPYSTLRDVPSFNLSPFQLILFYVLHKTLSTHNKSRNVIFNKKRKRHIRSLISTNIHFAVFIKYTCVNYYEAQLWTFHVKRDKTWFRRNVKAGLFRRQTPRWWWSPVSTDITFHFFHISSSGFCGLRRNGIWTEWIALFIILRDPLVNGSYFFYLDDRINEGLPRATHHVHYDTAIKKKARPCRTFYMEIISDRVIIYSVIASNPIFLWSFSAGTR